MQRRLTCTLGLLLGASCGRVGFDARSADAARADAVPDAAPLGPFGSATAIASLVYAGASSDDPCVTEDLLEMYFNSDRPGGPGGSDIWVSTRPSASDLWGTPTIVTQLNSTGNDDTPEVTPEGLVIRFTSNRAGTSGSYDIMEATRATRADAWSTPTFVASLNTTGFEGCPASADGDRLLVLCAGPSGANLQPHLVSRPTQADSWGARVQLSELDAGAYQSDPQLDAAGLALVFAAGTTSTDTDLYESSRPDPSSPFGPAVPIVELNGATREDGPWMSDDRRYVVFASGRSGAIEIWDARR